MASDPVATDLPHGTKRRSPMLRRTAWLAVVGFLLNGNWEWLQTPFYDDRAIAITTVVWYRLHCTMVDVVILLGCAVVLTLLRRGTSWLERPAAPDMTLLAGIGTMYTALSEQLNVGVRAAWAYSPLMPVIPGTAIGLVPLLQWVLLPPAAVLLAARLDSARQS